MSDPDVRAETITMQTGNTPPSARPNLDIDSSEILGNIHKQSLDSDISVETQAKDVVSSVPHSGLNYQSSLRLEKGMKASVDGSQPENQKAAIKSTPVLTGEVLSPAHSQNATSPKPMTDLQSTPRTIEDMWNVLIEVKSSVEHILFGMANLTHQVKAGDPSTRNPTVMPLVASKLNGVKVTLWAKMDTGADKNFISPALISRLGRDSDVKKDDGGVIHEIDNKSFKITHSVEIGFHAGLSEKRFTEKFYIVDAKTEAQQTNPAESLVTPNGALTQGVLHVPDILLGGPFLKKSHALVTDPDFENPANPEYEVLADPPEAGWNSCYSLISGKPPPHPKRALVKNPASVRGPMRSTR